MTECILNNTLEVCGWQAEAAAETELRTPPFRMVGSSEAIPPPCNSFADVGGHLAMRIALRSASGARRPFLNRSAFGHFPGANSTGKLLSRSIQITYK